MWSICKKEWSQYFSSLTGYLIISFYLLVNGLLLFVLPNYNVFDFGYTSLQVYFDFAPWLLLFLVPVITMRSFSEEYKQGTYEVLATLPVSKYNLVIAKFFGAFLIVVTAIVPTLFYAFALDKLSSIGGLDWGATLGSYIGLLFLAAVYTIVGVFVSAKTKNNLVAILVSILICVFLYKGFDAVSAFNLLPSNSNYYLTQLGISEHYQNMSKGLIAAKDKVYFLSLLILFTVGSVEQIKGTIKYTWVTSAVLALNIIVYLFPMQLDLTQDHRYTLSNKTKELVRAIDAPTSIHVYLGGDLPIPYQKMSSATLQLLTNLKKINPTQISITVEVPNELFKDTALYKFYDSLVKLGLPIERIQNENGKEDKRVDQLVVPGALVEVPGKAPYIIDLRSSKKYFKPYNIVKDIPEEDPIANENAAEALLENKFTQALYLLHRKEIPTIAYLIGNGEPVDLTVNDLGALIKEQYQLKVFDLKKGYPDPSKIKTLLIVKPSQTFTMLDKLKIDQYIMHGGNIIWAIDKLNAEYDSLRNSEGSYVAMDRGLGLDDLFFKYGLRINSNLVQDLNCAKVAMVTGKKPDGSPLMNRVPWPYYPFVTGNDNAFLSQNIDRVLTAFPSSIDTLKVPGIQKTILLFTDTSSRIVTSPNLVSLQSVKGESDMLQFAQHHLPVAVLLEGKFSSLYANRISSLEKDSIQKATGKSFEASALQSSKQIVLSDANILTNQVKPDEQGNFIPLPMGMLPMEEYQFGNRDFYLNSISFLNEPTSLLENRQKTIVLRVLDRQKLVSNRLFWQLLLVLGPLLFLWVGGWFWWQNRKRSFATLG